MGMSLKENCSGAGIKATVDPTELSDIYRAAGWDGPLVVRVQSVFSCV